MNIPSARTWIVGDLIVAAFLNAIRDAINFLLATPTTEGYVSAAQSLGTSGAWTNIALDGSNINNDGMWVTGTNTRFTCVTAGTYLVSGQVAYASNNTGRRLAGIGSNGGTANIVQTEVAVNPNNATAVAIPPRRVHLNVGDYLQLQGFQSSGGSLALSTGNSNTFLSVQMASTL